MASQEEQEEYVNFDGVEHDIRRCNMKKAYSPTVRFAGQLVNAGSKYVLSANPLRICVLTGLVKRRMEFFFNSLRTHGRYTRTHGLVVV